MSTTNQDTQLGLVLEALSRLQSDFSLFRDEVRSAINELLGRESGARPPHGEHGEYRVGEWGELYMPVLEELREKLRQKYPDGYMYPPGGGSHTTPGGTDLRVRVDLPKAVMWPGTKRYFRLNEKQANCIDANHSKFIFLLQSNSYGWRFTPQALEATVGPSNRWEYGEVLKDVWTTTTVDQETIQALVQAIRTFVKRAYDVE